MENDRDIHKLGLGLDPREWLNIEHRGEHFRFRLARPNCNARLKIEAPMSFVITREPVDETQTAEAHRR